MKTIFGKSTLENIIEEEKIKISDMGRAPKRYDAKRYDIERPAEPVNPVKEGHNPLSKEEFERMLKLAGVSASDLKTTEGILKAKRKVLDTLEAPKGPFVQNGIKEDKRYGDKVKNQIEEVNIVKESEPKAVSILKKSFLNFVRWIGWPFG